ncbi:transmembrane 9 superfamily member 1 [Tanacetum coccineum]
MEENCGGCGLRRTTAAWSEDDDDGDWDDGVLWDNDLLVRCCVNGGVTSTSCNQGVDIQLGLAINSTKATLAVKRRLACEMVKYWQQIHWFSRCNTFMMVIFLTGLVSMILMRTLRNDYAKYAREEDDLETLVNE